MPGKYRVHRRVALDINSAEIFYLNESGADLADRFTNELLEAFQEAANHPTKAHFDVLARCKRVNLDNFPYHFLYDIYSDYIYIFVVRHDKRRPSYGLRRIR